MKILFTVMEMIKLRYYVSPFSFQITVSEINKLPKQ